MRVRAALAAITLAGSTLGLAGTAAAQDEHANVCESFTTYGVSSYVTKHKPGGAQWFKDGPAPKGGLDVTYTETQSSSTSTTFTGNVSFEWGALFAKVKTEIGATVNKTTNWSGAHSVKVHADRYKYANAQFGSWGKLTHWYKDRVYPDCHGERLGTGTGSVATKAKGFRVWVTNS